MAQSVFATGAQPRRKSWIAGGAVILGLILLIAIGPPLGGLYVPYDKFDAVFIVFCWDAVHGTYRGSGTPAFKLSPAGR